MLLKTLITLVVCPCRCCEQRSMVRSLNSPACLEQAAHATQGGSNFWVLHWLVALMEAAGGHLEALEWLLHQVHRCIASQGTEGKRTPNSLVSAAGA